MYTGGADGSARCWVTEFGDCTRHYKGGTRSVCFLHVRGNILFTGCGDGIARAYDAKSAALRRQYVGHESAINCLACIDEKLFTGSSDGTMRVWDAKDIIEDLNADDEPPPAPAEVQTQQSMIDSLDEKLDEYDGEGGEDEETPEDGIENLDEEPSPEKEEDEEDDEEEKKEDDADGEDEKMDEDA